MVLIFCDRPDFVKVAIRLHHGNSIYAFILITVRSVVVYPKLNVRYGSDIVGLVLVCMLLFTLVHPYAIIFI